MTVYEKAKKTNALAKALQAIDKISRLEEKADAVDFRRDHQWVAWLQNLPTRFLQKWHGWRGMRPLRRQIQAALEGEEFIQAAKKVEGDLLSAEGALIEALSKRARDPSPTSEPDGVEAARDRLVLQIYSVDYLLGRATGIQWTRPPRNSEAQDLFSFVAHRRRALRAFYREVEKSLEAKVILTANPQARACFQSVAHLEEMGMKSKDFEVVSVFFGENGYTGVPLDIDTHGSLFLESIYGGNVGVALRAEVSLLPRRFV
jgi:hypothetical protein